MVNDPHPSRTVEQDGGQTPSSFNPMQIAWRHLWLILLGIIVGVILGTIFYSRLTPLYQSVTQLLVSKKAPEYYMPGGTANPSGGYAEDYLMTQAKVITSQKVVFDALNRIKEGPLAGRTDLFTEITYNLKVTRETVNNVPTNILSLSYRNSEPADCLVFLDELVKSYENFLRHDKNIPKDIADLIKEASEKLKKELKEKKEQYEKFKEEHPVIIRNKEGNSLSQERQFALEARHLSLIQQEADILGRIEAFKKAVNDKRYVRADLLAMIDRSKTAGESTGSTFNLEESLVKLELEKDTLEETYGKAYPPLKALKAQITKLKNLIDRRGRSSDDDSVLTDPVKVHLFMLDLELENCRMACSALNRFLKAEQEEAKKLYLIESQDKKFSDDIARSETYFASISEKLRQVNMLEDFTTGVTVQTMSVPTTPKKVYPSAVTCVGLGALLGLMVGFGLGYLAELSDQSFRTPEEIRRQVGLAVIGHIPHFAPNDGDQQPVGPDGQPVDFGLCSIYNPKSRQSESYRGVRTAVLFNNRSTGRKVYQVTSPDMGDGKSTLSSNLAVSLAQSEKKVILIDADFRRPRVHKLFNVPATQGLASVINGESQLQEVIQPTSVPNLYVLPCGPIPNNPAELLSVNRFHEILAQIREQFDFVLIDTPPLLAVTDPCIVVPHVDSVILTIRISKNARPSAIRAKEILSTLGANVLGVVVNGVGQDSGYGYGPYRYGYTYRYTDYYQNYRSDEQPATGDKGGSDPTKPATTPPSPVRTTPKSKGLFGWFLNMLT